jgi:hypothetical protein
VAFVHEAPQKPLAHDRVAEVSPCELDLAGARLGEIEGLEDPLVEGPMVRELERAEGVRDVLDRVRQAMREVVHRIDRPLAAGPVVGGLHHPIEDRVAHR